MRGSTMHAQGLGICGNLSWDVVRLLPLQEWLFGARPKYRPRAGGRSLHIEPLEVRHLMDAAGLASLVDPMWFQSTSDLTGPEHAGVATWTAEDTIAAIEENTESSAAEPYLYDWIVQFDTASLTGISSVVETVGLLTGGGIDFQVICGLGLTGQVLARSSGASLSSVTDWLADNVYVSTFEQDAVGQLETAPNDPYLGSLWGMDAIDAAEAWSLATGSQSVVVAVIDTGVDYMHADLAANIWTNPGEIAGNGIDDDGNGFIDDVHGYDFANNDGDPMDDNNHGTHVSGTIAAVGNNSRGVVGVNWSTSIMALKFLSSSGSGYLSDAIQAVNYATMMRTQYGVNIRVENNSWGGGSFSSAMQSAIQANNDAGILFVAAAGNSASNNDVLPQYPANYTPANVVSVAASNQYDQLASFSSYGATTVDLAAPGVSIYSTITNNRYASYSGTSMATPHVAGVAALAWSVAPNASVAEIRSAILEGADPVAALSGVVATGGRLNAYNTLQLLNVQPPAGPVVASMAISPAMVMAGSTVTLEAQGISDATGNVVAVFFSWDSDYSGYCNVGDTIVGSTTTVVNGEASMTLDTTGMTPGTYRFFAAAINDNSVWSIAASTTLTVLAADDHGGSAALATVVGVGSTAQGVIGIAGDRDCFKFQAVAGKTYTFATQLGTLRDSTLTLYSTNGTTQLAFDDDAGEGLASRIVWTAPASGTYYLAVASYADYYAGSYSLNVQVQNSAPSLTPIADQTISHTQTTVAIPLSVSDADGDSLSYSTQALAIDPLAQKAYNLDQQLGLYQWCGSYYTNLRGANEKYVVAANGDAYFFVPSGDLYKWGGSIAASTLYTTFSPEYWANPLLLHNAEAPTYTPIDASDVAVNISGGVLTITRAVDHVDNFEVRVSVSDGLATATDTFNVTITNAAPQLTPIADQTISHTQTTVAISLSVGDADGDSLSYSVQALAIDPLAQKAYNLDQQLGLYQWCGSYYTNLRGANEKYVVSPNGDAFFFLPSGDLYKWGGSIAASTLYTTFSPEYWANPLLLHNAQAPTYTAVDAVDVAVSISGGVLTITRAADYTDSFIVQTGVTDGLATVTDTFNVSITNSAPQLTSIADQTVSYTQTTVAIPLSVSDADGDSLSYSTQALAIDPLAQKAYNLDQQLGLYQWSGSYYTNLRGANEKYVVSPNGDAFFFLPSGDLYKWGGSIAASTLYTTFSPEYWANPLLLHNAQAPTYTAVDAVDVAVSITDGVLTMTRADDYSNSFIVRVGITDGLATVTDTFNVSITNFAPQLTSIDNQVMLPSENTLRLSVAATDVDGDGLTYSAQVLATDPLAQKAYNLDQQLGLYQWCGSYYTNLRGANEKYVVAANGDAYFFVPSGELYKWCGSIAASTPYDMFSPAYWADPSLLHNAQAPTQATAVGSNVTASMAGNVLTVNRAAGYSYDFFVQVAVSDGTNTASETFRVSAAAAASFQTDAMALAPSAIAAERCEPPRVASPAVSVSVDRVPTWVALESHKLLMDNWHGAAAGSAAGKCLTGSSRLSLDSIFDQFVEAEGLTAGPGRLETLLDSRNERLSADGAGTALLSPMNTVSTRLAGSDTDRMLSGVCEELWADDLLAGSSRIEREVIDEIFDLLGSVQ